MRQWGLRPLNSIICAINISPSFCFDILFRKNWRDAGGLLFKVGIIDGYYCNHAIA